jgi:GTP 3',8-cyclase
MQCTYCDHVNRKGVQISYGNIIEILQACFNAGIRNIHWTGGEPTARTDFVEIVEFAKKCGFICQKMTTNGASLYPLADALKKAGLKRVNVSLDSLLRENYNILTGSSKFDMVVSGIKKASTCFDTIKINVCVTKQTVCEIQDFIKFASEIPNKPIIKFMELVPCGNVYEANSDLFSDTYVPIEKIEKILRETYTFVPAKAVEYSRQKCNYYYIPSMDVTFGLNPNLSIDFACQRSNCIDLRVNPAGYISDCSTNLKNLVFLTPLTLEEKTSAIRDLLIKKSTRNEKEWADYRHKQKYYGFWRFGEQLSDIKN